MDKFFPTINNITKGKMIMIPNNLDNHAGDFAALCDRLDAPYRPGAKARAEKAFKMLEFIKDSMSPESVVCDSIMRCQGWERWAATIFSDIKDSWKYCPWCQAQLTKEMTER